MKKELLIVLKMANDSLFLTSFTVLAASSVIVYVIIDILYLFFDPRVKF